MLGASSAKALATVEARRFGLIRTQRLPAPTSNRDRRFRRNRPMDSLRVAQNPT